MENPFISICIPAYKRAQNLQRLLTSIASQTYSNYEIIITDDSPDESVADLVKKNSGFLSIRYFKNDPAAGTPGNWNIAIKKAKGEWIKLMHDDDWFALPASLQKFADAAANAKCNFIFSACNNIYTSSGKEVNEFLTGWRKDLIEENSLNLFYLNVIGHPSTILHRKDDGILYDNQFKWVVDIDFYIRYLQKHKGFRYIPEMLVNIGTDDTQVSYSLYKNPVVEIPEYLSLLAKFPSDLLLKYEYVFYCVWNLVKRFRIRNKEMIVQLGYTGSLPDHIQDIINYQKNVPRIIIKQTNWSKILMKRCFKKLKTQGQYK
jgi:glycosyltransferase involved in cell wall biosynthesis